MITAQHFQEATGLAPSSDDLERCNCPVAGHLLHWDCGWNYACNLPNFMANYLVPSKPYGNLEEII